MHLFQSRGVSSAGNPLCGGISQQQPGGTGQLMCQPDGQHLPACRGRAGSSLTPHLPFLWPVSLGAISQSCLLPVSKTCSFPSENINHFLASQRTAWGNGPGPQCSLCTPFYRSAGQGCVPFSPLLPAPTPNSHTSPQTYTLSPSTGLTPGLLPTQPHTEDWGRCRAAFVQQVSPSIFSVLDWAGHWGDR